MPFVTNKSARVYHFDAGMCGPGQTVELQPDELEKPFVQLMLASGEVVEEKDQKKLEAAEKKLQSAEKSAESQVGKAQEGVAKTEQQVQQAHLKQAGKA